MSKFGIVCFNSITEGLVREEAAVYFLPWQILGIHTIKIRKGEAEISSFVLLTDFVSSVDYGAIVHLFGRFCR